MKYSAYIVDWFLTTHVATRKAIEAVLRLQVKALQSPEVLSGANPDFWQFLGALVYSCTHGKAPWILSTLCEAVPRLARICLTDETCLQEFHEVRRACLALQFALGQEAEEGHTKFG